VKELLLTLLLFAQGATPQVSGGGSIAGRVLSLGGLPTTGVVVIAEPQAVGNPMHRTARTDSSGQYRLLNIPPGRYYVTAGPVDAPIYFPGVANHADAKIFTITDGAAFESQDIRLPVLPGVTLRGRVIPENIPAGETFPTVQVRLAGERGQPNVVTGIASNGSFEISDVPEGGYTISVEPNFQPVPSIRDLYIDKNTKEVQIHVPFSSIVADISGTMSVMGPVKLSLTVILKSTNPNSSRILQNGERRFGIGSSETFALSQVPLGEYTIEVPNLPEGYKVQSMTGVSVISGSTDLLSQPLRVRATDQPKIAITVGVSDPPPWVQVRGVFTSRDATTPLPKSLTIGSATTPVNPDGTFEFPAVLPGTYNVKLTPSSDNFTRTITIGKSGPALVEVPLTLPSVRISGRVTGENQMKQQGRMKADEIFVPLLSRVPGPPGNNVVAETSPDGTFVFPKVQAGTYTVNLERTCRNCDYGSINTSNQTTIVVGDKDIRGLEIPAH
jgi:hypothetical protein